MALEGVILIAGYELGMRLPHLEDSLIYGEVRALVEGTR